MTPLLATAAISATRRPMMAELGDAAGAGVSCTRGSQAVAPSRANQFNYSGPPLIPASRVLPAFIPQVHPARLPAGQLAAALRTGRADRQSRSSRDAEPAGSIAGGAGRPRQQAALRAGDDARTPGAPASDSRRSAAHRRLCAAAARFPADLAAAIAIAARSHAAGSARKTDRQRKPAR